jgi:hypothetical protein
MAAREQVALRALQLQANFEVIDKGSELAAAMLSRREAAQHAAAAAAQRQALLQELRRLQEHAAINLALLAALRRSYRAALDDERATQAELARAAHAEEARRDELAVLRHRARHLERAVLDAAAALHAQRQTLDAARLDDLWLARRLGGTR